MVHVWKENPTPLKALMCCTLEWTLLKHAISYMYPFFPKWITCQKEPINQMQHKGHYSHLMNLFILLTCEVIHFKPPSVHVPQDCIDTMENTLHLVATLHCWKSLVTNYWGRFKAFSKVPSYPVVSTEHTVNKAWKLITQV